MGLRLATVLTLRLVLSARALLAEPVPAPDDGLSDMWLEELMNVDVVSASKQLQSSLEAPAKVIIITAREIQLRGQLDLEEILHDVAGFDFEKGQGGDVRVSAYNLTNTRYFDSGVRSADGSYYNGAILQLPFRIFAGVGYRY